MAKADELLERYLKVYEMKEDADDLLEELKEEFLKEEMEEIFEKCDMEVKTGWTKDEMAEEMLSEDFYEKVVTILKPSEEKKEEKSEKRKSVFSPSEFLKGIDLDFSEKDYMKKFWRDLQKEAETGLEDFKISPEKYWLEIEKMWKEQSEIIQKNIERLAKTKIPEDDVEKLKNEWNKFTQEMSFHLKEIPIEIELKKNSISGIIEKHTDESKEIMSDSERELRELYPLWFDMVKKVREELEEGRNVLENKEEELYDTWENFSNTISEELEELSEEYPAADDLLDKWNLISKKLDVKISKVPEKHDHIYRDFWESLGKKRPKLARKIEEITEKTEKDYMNMIEDALEPIRETYEQMIKPDKKKKDEIKELKERIAELEKKLDEK